MFKTERKNQVYPLFYPNKSTHIHPQIRQFVQQFSLGEKTMTQTNTSLYPNRMKGQPRALAIRLAWNAKLKKLS